MLTGRPTRAQAAPQPGGAHLRPELPAWAGLAMMGWLTVVLWLDRAGGSGGPPRQWLLGGLTWLVLLVVGRRLSPVVRAQTAVVVVAATIVEYTFSPGLGVYSYRFGNVPAFVPPGHGLVYLSALALGHAALVRRHPRASVAAVLVAGGAWAGAGLLAERPDVLGAFWFGCLALFVWRGPSRAVYLGAFVAVSWLELAGTRLGTWEWAPRDPTGWISIGNPPSGAAGGYGWFDLAGLLLAPYVVALVGLIRPRRSRPTQPGRPDDAERSGRAPTPDAVA